jgi:DNA-binding beta-propeller fold protein YncE
MMNLTLRRLVLGLGLVCAVGASRPAFGQTYGMFAKEPLPMIQRSVLPNETEGRMAGIGYDPMTGCMYFAAVRANVLHVLDKSGMEQVQTVAGLNEPNGIAVAADLRKLALSCGDGSVHIYSIGAEQKDAAGKVTSAAGKLAEEKVLSFAGEADPIRYDAKSKKAYVGHGKYVSWIDMEKGEKSPKGVEMPGSVKGLVISPDGSMVYVNVPSKGVVVVVDTAKWEVAKTFELKDATGNYPLAINEDGSMLFVACRNPAKLLMLNAADGKEQARFDIGNDDAADCWWDAGGKRVYITSGNGNGMVTMIWNKPGATPSVQDMMKDKVRMAEMEKEKEQIAARMKGGASAWVVEHNIETAPGARTSLLIPERGRFIVCAPKITYPTFVFIYLTPGANEHHDKDPNQGH